MTSYRQQLRPIVAMPELTRRYGNGQAPVDELELVFPKLGRFGHLAPAAARAWRAMEDAAARAGHRLYATGASRPYSDQVALFRQRYDQVTVWRPGVKRWEGKWWALRKGMATAATPGTSNHGWYIAVDAACVNDAGATIPLTAGALAWLEDHASVYGWGWELKSEPWHIRHLYGDDVTPAVVEHERQQSIDPPPTTHRRPPVFLATLPFSKDTWLITADGRRRRLTPIAASVLRRRPEFAEVPMVLTREELDSFTEAP